MKRLTFEGNFCDIALCLERPGGEHCGDGACSQRKVWERLKYFEDLAEQGRLKILPCAVGDMVYKFFNDTGERPGKKRYKAIIQEQSRLKYLVRNYISQISIVERPFKESDYVKLGKTVFLTREEAEQALGGAENGT